jgi:hypothetical protein
MQPKVVFGISVLLGFVVWGMIGARYIWPALRGRPRSEALRPVLLLHAFRFVGLAFLVPRARQLGGPKCLTSGWY